MIERDALIALFERMYEEHWAYEWGAAKAGCVDCSGAFVYAFSVLGGPAIEHGSNAIARKRAGTMRPVSEAQPGWAAFKWRQEGAPDGYADGLGDYYHIGLVDQTGRCVLNAKGTEEGFSLDPLTRFDFAAPLDAVSYPDEENHAAQTYQARVVTQEDPLRLRDAPDGEPIGKLPRGAIVQVLEERGEWFRVRYEESVGYASAQYLERIEDPAQGEAMTTLVDQAGNAVTLMGSWHVV